MINHDPHKKKVEITHFFNKIKIIQINIKPKINLIIMHKIIFHQMMKNNITKIINDFTPTKNLDLTILGNQIFLNHTYEMNKYDNLELTQHHTTIIFNNQIQSTHQATQMQNEIPLPYYLQQHEIIKSQLTNFSQMPIAAESLQMTMNPYLMGGSSITSNKPLMVFSGTDPEYSVEDYLNAVTANLILNIGTEPVNTPLHQNWIHRRTALIHTTLDGAAQKLFSVLPIEIKSDWKRFTQDFSKIFHSERNKQPQRVLCNEIPRLPNETIK